jgi:8-oxo-dGTP diphosphatase
MPPRTPSLTVDIIIRLVDRPHFPIVLIERKYEPLGWALPGGFVDYGEKLESAALREAQEETGLAVHLLELFHVYSDPARDRRQHTASVVYLAEATGELQSGDDAKSAQPFLLWELPQNLCFDHAQILRDYRHFCLYGSTPRLS